MKLILGKPYIQDIEDKSRLCCDVVFKDGETITRREQLWYEVDKKYREFLCTERQDGTLVSILSYAMHHGMDIECEEVVSEDLYYQLTMHYIKIVADNIPYWNKEISVRARTTLEKLDNANAVGAPVSCGVDSFYSIYENLLTECSSFKVTHLLLLNAGGTGNSGDEMPRAWFNEKIKLIMPYIISTNLHFVAMDTCLNEFYDAGDEGCHHSSACRIMGCVLTLQKLFCKYHFASGFTPKDFEFSEDPHTFDIFNVLSLSNMNITAYSSGMQLERIDKVAKIADYEPAHQYLNVCNHGFDNCSNCEKCVRTMSELFANGQLEKFADVFDVKYYKKNYKKLLARYITSNEHRQFYKLIEIRFRKNNISIPIWVYICSFFVMSPYVHLRNKLKDNKIVRKAYEIMGGVKKFPPIR